MNEDRKIERTSAISSAPLNKHIFIPWTCLLGNQKQKWNLEQFISLLHLCRYKQYGTYGGSIVSEKKVYI